MAKDAIVSEELAKKFSTEKDTPYLRWVREEGLDIISAHYVAHRKGRWPSSCRAAWISTKGSPRSPRGSGASISS